LQLLPLLLMRLPPPLLLLILHACVLQLRQRWLLRLSHAAGMCAKPCLPDCQ
jgi:hypothetical protein